MNYSRLELSGTYRETAVQTKGLASAARREGFRFDRFYLKMVLIDESGRILASQPLLAIAYRRHLNILSFKQDITLPPKTEAITFTFRGSVGDAGKGPHDSINWYFSKTPY